MFEKLVRKLVPDFAKISAPLMELLTVDQKDFNACRADGGRWAKVKKAVYFLKTAMITRPALALPQKDNYSDIVRTDASDFAIGATLRQLQLSDSDPVERIMAYFSRTLHDAETRHSTYDKELLGVRDAVEHWKYYLNSAPDTATHHAISSSSFPFQLNDAIFPLTLAALYPPILGLSFPRLSTLLQTLLHLLHLVFSSPLPILLSHLPTLNKTMAPRPRTKDRRNWYVPPHTQGICVASKRKLTCKHQRTGRRDSEKAQWRGGRSSRSRCRRRCPKPFPASDQLLGFRRRCPKHIPARD